MFILFVFVLRVRRSISLQLLAPVSIPLDHRQQKHLCQLLQVEQLQVVLEASCSAHLCFDRVWWTFTEGFLLLSDHPFHCPRLSGGNKLFLEPFNLYLLVILCWRFLQCPHQDKWEWQRNPGNPPLCHSLSPKIPRLFATFILLFRVFSYFFVVLFQGIFSCKKEYLGGSGCHSIWEEPEVKTCVLTSFPQY